MGTLSYCPREDCVCQVAFVVDDVRSSIEHFAKTFHAGPWALFEEIHFKNAQYRGQPFEFRGSIAVANTGHLQVELISQADDEVASIFTEVIKKKGYGFHHHGIAVRNFDAHVTAYQNLGYEVAYYCELEVMRIAMMDTRGKLPFFVEVLEMTDPAQAFFENVYRASLDWDGQTLIGNFS